MAATGPPPGLTPAADLSSAMANAVNSSKAYEKLQVPPLPNPGKVRQWMMAISESLVRTSLCIDEIEVGWLFDVYDKTIEELGKPSPTVRLQRADMCLAVQVEAAINKSSESVTCALELKKTAIRQRGAGS